MSDRKSVAVLTHLTLESLENRSLLSISSIVDIAADSGNDNLSVIESQSVSDSDAKYLPMHAESSFLQGKTLLMNYIAMQYLRRLKNTSTNRLNC